MNTLRFWLVAVAVVTIVNGTQAKDERPQPARAAQPAKAPSTAAGVEAKLAKGMSADEVRALLGQPYLIRPMEAPGAKAEVWVYRERVSDSLMPVQIGSKPIMVTTISDGQSSTQKVGEEPIYKNQRTTKYRVVSLLMFDGKYVVYKVAQEEERSFE